MRIAVISDIHANFSALSAVLGDLDRREVDAVWCLGDMIGRGFQPTSSVSSLISLYNQQQPVDQAAWLCGNHEMLLLKGISTGWLGDENQRLTASGDNHYAIKTIRDNLAELEYRPKLLEWLGKFPSHSHPYERVYLAHGVYSLLDDGSIDEDNAFRVYLFHDAIIKDMLERMEQLMQVRSGLVMSGHTHVSGLWQRTMEGITHLSHLKSPLTFDLGRDFIYINPGSVGFPRGADSCPTYVILTTIDDFKSLTVEFFVVPYDTSTIEFPYDYPDVYRAEIQKCGQSQNA